MKQYLFAFLFVFLLVFLLFPYLKVHASVVLNEVAIQPNQAVELYNTASTSADISGWYIDDSGGTTYYTIPQLTVLAPLSCYVLTADFNLNKTSADTVRLFDNSSPPTTSSAKLLESYPYVKAPDSGYSFIKKTDGGNEWHTSVSSLGLFNETLVSCIPSPTPTPLPTETPIPTPTLTPTPPVPAEVLHEGGTPTDYSNIFISEVFPYPIPGEHEWIELYNNNDVEVVLEKWYVDDGENTGSTPKVFSLIIEAHSYGVVDISASLFNNSGDTVRILNFDKTEKDSMEYGKGNQEKSVGRISFENNEYCEQETSKNGPNTDCIQQATLTTKSTASTNTNSSPIKIAPSSTKKQTFALSQNVPIKTNRLVPTAVEINGDVLGVTIPSTHPRPLTPLPYLSSVSFSYSLLTIVSILIKMKSA